MITKKNAKTEIEAALMRKVTGYELREEKTITEEDANGAVKTKREQTVKEVGPDHSAIVTILKARIPERWDVDSAKPTDPVIQVVSQIPRPGLEELGGQSDDPSAEL